MGHSLLTPEPSLGRKDPELSPPRWTLGEWVARAQNLSIIMGQPAGWLLGSYGRRCWAGGAEIWQDSQAGRQQLWDSLWDYSFPHKQRAGRHWNHVQNYFKDFLLREQSSWKESWLEGSSQDMVTRAPAWPHNIYSFDPTVYRIGRRWGGLPCRVSLQTTSFVKNLKIPNK